MIRLLVFVSVLLARSVPVPADWPQFRGAHCNGSVAGDRGPQSLQKVAWKAVLPGRGLSGPIVVGRRVILTACSGFDQDRLHVLCFETRTGRKLWERQFWATGRTQSHPKTCVAAPTPASDGRRVFAFFSSNDLACLDLDGNLLWYRGLGRDFPNASNSLGMASSPVVVDERVIVQVESDAEAFAAGLDVKTGVTRWRIERPRKANWTTTAVLRNGADRQNLALLQSSRGIQAVEARTGKIAWQYEEGASTISSSTIAGGAVFVPSHGLTALRPVPGGSTPALIWRERRMGPSTITPLVHRGEVLSINSAGVVSAADAATGKILRRLRLRGPFTSSPVAADGRAYFFNEDGRGFVLEIPGDRSRGRLVDEKDFGETFLCTPAVADGALYIRSDEHLWKIGGGNDQ